MGRKSLTANAMLNIIRIFSGIIIPIVTLPYLLRVIGIEGMGAFNYSQSIVSYFVMLSGLGFQNYAVREGSKVKNDRKSLSRFASQMLSLNLLSMVISLILLFIAIISVQRLADYFWLILVLGTEIVSSVINMSWVCNVLEDFKFLTVVGVLSQIVSAAFIFIFLHSPDSLMLYAVLSVLVSLARSVITIAYIGKYVDLSLTLHIGKEHLKPIFVLFASAVAFRIYIDSDITVLGWIEGAKSVGVYLVAVKAYSIVKQFFSAITMVVVPKVGYLVGSGEKGKVSDLLTRFWNYQILLLIPSAAGLIMLSDGIVDIIAGQSLAEAGLALRILSISMIFAVLSNFYANCILITHGKEKMVSVAMILAAVLNMGLNILLIPIWGVTAAAATTLVAEMTVFGVSVASSRGLVSVKKDPKNMVITFTGGIAIVLICYVVHNLVHNNVIYIILSVILSAFVYFGLHFAGKNTVFMGMNILRLKNQ